MIIKITRKEALKFVKMLFGRKASHGVKKFEKKRAKNPKLAKDWDGFVDDIDKLMAYGDKDDGN